MSPLADCRRRRQQRTDTDPKQAASSYDTAIRDSFYAGLRQGVLQMRFEWSEALFRHLCCTNETTDGNETGAMAGPLRI